MVRFGDVATPVRGCGTRFAVLGDGRRRGAGRAVGGRRPHRRVRRRDPPGPGAHRGDDLRGLHADRAGPPGGRPAAGGLGGGRTLPRDRPRRRGAGALRPPQPGHLPRRARPRPPGCRAAVVHAGAARGRLARPPAGGGVRRIPGHASSRRADRTGRPADGAAEPSAIGPVALSAARRAIRQARAAGGGGRPRSGPPVPPALARQTERAPPRPCRASRRRACPA